MEKTKRKTFFTLLVRLFSLGVLLFVVFMLWSRTQLDIVLMDIIDSREITLLEITGFANHPSVEFDGVEAGQFLRLSAEGIERFRYSFLDYELEDSTPQSETRLYPNNDFWNLSAERQLFGSLDEPSFGLVMEFEESAQETIFFNENHLYIDGTYYEMDFNPLMVMLLEELTNNDDW
ncbi:hypothetical protein CLV38_101139 [Alkalibacterium olivapovliticus]|uniref:Uncharacterized protein n=1 Tax=Alkalibacterium olivapovliticus TaxID=99907 RepID=A0A2T0WBZ5_9LACT|nr:hypothetical protein CLV38_101139 [Alkalibacterium olivapovliticus]